MRWQQIDGHPHRQRAHKRCCCRNGLSSAFRNTTAVLRYGFQLAQFAALLLILGCGPPRAVVVPSYQLSTWRIQSEPVQIETAAPFVERIALRAATMKFPLLTGVVSAFDAPWAVGVLQKPLSLDTRDGLQVEVLPPTKPTTDLGDAAPSSGPRVMVRTPGPFPSRIELRSAVLANSQISGVVHAVDSTASSKAVGQSIVLDVRTLSRVSVFSTGNEQKTVGTAFIWTGVGGALVCGLGGLISSSSFLYIGSLGSPEAMIGFSVGLGLSTALAVTGIVLRASAGSTRP